MVDKIDIKFDKDLDYIIELKGELVEAKTLMENGSYPLDKYRGATHLLDSYLAKYNNLSANAKNHLKVNINELEARAIKILFEQGHLKMVKEDLAKKHGYAVKEK